MPRSLDMLGNTSPPTPTGGGGIAPNAYQQFNTALLGLMKEHQSLGTKPFVQQSLNAQETQANRTMQTPSNLIGANPGLQSQVRSASAQALNPTIQGAQQAGQTFSEQLNSFGNLINFTRQINQDYAQAQERAQDRAFSQVMEVIQTYGGGAFKDMDDNELKSLEKTAGLPSGFLRRAGSIKTLSEQITPYQQATLDQGKAGMEEERRQFDETRKISPYQQASLEEGKRQFDVKNPNTPPRNLLRGDTGADVEALQRYLVSLGYLTQADMNTGPGIYGPRTEAAVQKLQAAFGVTGETGVGPRTQAKLKMAGFTLPQNSVGAGLSINAGGDEWEVIEY